MYPFFGILFLFALLFFFLNHWRKRCVIEKICCMPHEEKLRMLNGLIEPFGYQYLPCQDIFFSTFDAWQREFGYSRSYDCLAPYFNMVFDSEPIYFDYNNRTWLVELWKGQYGINTGAEIGIYCADGIVPPSKRSRELFHSVSDEEIPLFSMNLKRITCQGQQDIANLSMPHWWLSAFRMGCFSKPCNLCADFCISFPDCGMLYAFSDALSQLGYRTCSTQICNSSICFSYRFPQTPAPCRILTRLFCLLSQWENRFFCWLYRMVTQPFYCTVDRLLCLYFYLPFCFRCCLRLHRRKKRPCHKRKPKRKGCHSSCGSKNWGGIR